MKTSMNRWWLAALLGAAAVGLAGAALAPKKAAPPKPKLAVSIKPQHVADNLRAVIISDREVYLKTAGRRVAEGGAWDDEKGWPAPCLLLRHGSEAAASKGIEFAYVLRALQPSAPRNAPETEFERQGLEAVKKPPGQPHYGEELLGGRWYFSAVYPEIATPACADCHNQLKSSPRKDYKPGDVLGGLVIRVALEL